MQLVLQVGRQGVAGNCLIFGIICFFVPIMFVGKRFETMPSFEGKVFVGTSFWIFPLMCCTVPTLWVSLMFEGNGF